MKIKLRRLGSLNLIVNDSKSDSNKFGRGLYDDSAFKVEIVLSILILIIFDQI